LVIEALIARPVLATDRHALFHGDPHAGNLFLTRDGRLALLDWSLIGELGKRERIALVQILLGALLSDVERMVSPLLDLAERSGVDRAALEGIVRNWLAQLQQGQLPGFTWLMGMVDEAVQHARLRVSADLLLFRKSLFTLEGVLRDIGTDRNRIEAVLLSQFLRQFVLEWPQRWQLSPSSRALATRLSNLDLAELIWRLPLATVRRWLERIREYTS
jgi:ubiquinone biosynthesis protein